MGKKCNVRDFKQVGATNATEAHRAAKQVEWARSQSGWILHPALLKP